MRERENATHLGNKLLFFFWWVSQRQREGFGSGGEHYTGVLEMGGLSPTVRVQTHAFMSRTAGFVRKCALKFPSHQSLVENPIRQTGPHKGTWHVSSCLQITANSMQNEENHSSDVGSNLWNQTKWEFAREKIREDLGEETYISGICWKS